MLNMVATKKYSNEKKPVRIERSNPFSVRYIQPGAIPFFFDISWLMTLRENYPEPFRNYYAESLVSAENVMTKVGVSFLVDFFEESDCKSQLVGPHGSGKSTLMQTLADTLVARGYQLFCGSLHDRQRSLTKEFQANLRRFAENDQPAPLSGRTTSPSLRQEGRFSTDGSFVFPSLETGSKKERKKIVFLDGFEQLSYVNAFSFRIFCRMNGLGLLISTHSPILGLPVLYRTAPNVALLQKVVTHLLDETDWSVGKDYISNLFRKHRGNFRDILFSLYDEYERSRIFSQRGEIASVCPLSGSKHK